MHVSSFSFDKSMTSGIIQKELENITHAINNINNIAQMTTVQVSGIKWEKDTPEEYRPYSSGDY